MASKGIEEFLAAKRHRRHNTQKAGKDTWQIAGFARLRSSSLVSAQSRASTRPDSKSASVFRKASSSQDEVGSDPSSFQSSSMIFSFSSGGSVCMSVIFMVQG